MKLAFLIVPWHALDYPCLAAGVLNAVALDSVFGWQVEQQYVNVEWAEYLFKVSSGNFSTDDYALFGQEFISTAAGEWIFSSALHGVDEWHPANYQALFGGTEEQFQKALFAHRHAPAFIQSLAKRIVDSGVDALALSSTFTQNVACLAIAKAVKALNPEIITMMGGGNCDGVQGIALHRLFPFIDFVIRGEGETAFPLLLSAIENKVSDLAHIPNLCWHRESRQIVNEVAEIENIEIVPGPHYDAYFKQIDQSAIRNFIEPVLVMETARGCWWGEKHHCTFCGLNGTSMKFRSKSEAKALAEMEMLISRHKILDLIVADNILDMGYFKTLLPTLKANDWDLRIHYEIKANLKKAQIELMRDAGIRHIQPGIESLSTKVLALMDKGVTGPRNIQALRDFEEANLTVSWNYLVGFPGELECSYDHIIKQIPNLFHLQPPTAASRMTLERFSPYFNKPWLGFESRWPHKSYALIYGLSDSELEDFAFFFDSPYCGISEDVRITLQGLISTWSRAYEAGSELIHNDLGDRIEVEDRRDAERQRTVLIDNPTGIHMFRSLRQPMRLAALRSQVERDANLSVDQVDAQLGFFVEHGLVFEDEGLLIGLPTESIPFKVRMN